MMNPYESPQEIDSPIPESKPTNSTFYRLMRTDLAILAIVVAAALDNVMLATQNMSDYIPVLRAAAVLVLFATILLAVNFKNGTLLKRIFYGLLIVICISIAADTFRRGAW